MSREDFVESWGRPVQEPTWVRDHHGRGSLQPEYVSDTAGCDDASPQGGLRSIFLCDARRAVCAAPDLFEGELQQGELGFCQHHSLDEILSAIDDGAVGVLKRSRLIEAWDTVSTPRKAPMVLDANTHVTQDEETLNVEPLATVRLPTARGKGDRCLCHSDYWSQVWAKTPRTNRLTSWLASPSRRVRVPAAVPGMPRLGHDGAGAAAAHVRADTADRRLDPGPEGPRPAREEAVTRELRLEARRRLESLSEVVKRAASQLRRMVWTRTDRLGGVCPPGAAHQRGERRAGPRHGRSLQAGVSLHPRGAT